MGYSVNPEAEGKNELPPWRKELSKRLKEIKHKREEPSAGSVEEKPPVTRPPAKQPKPKKKPSARKPKTSAAAGPPSPEPAPVAETKADHEAGKRPLKEEKTAMLPSDRSSEPPKRSSQPQNDPGTEKENRGSAEIRDLIDSMVTRKTDIGEANQISAPAPSVATPASKEDKLIFISRTFSGLVDLLIVVLAASSFIFAVDIIEGIEIFDTVSLLYYLALLIVTFFVYSIYFLLTACQTIGMMITDLRVVGTMDKRPTITQLFARCGSYIVALLGLGLGLLWGCFDRENRCLHDRLSGTRVIRILPY